MDFDLGLPLLSVYSGCCSNRDIRKAQYIRQFRKWGFEKNSNSDQWKAVARQVRKRKSRGKNSEIYIQDKRILDEKLRKETSRYAPPIDDHECSSKKFLLRCWTRVLTPSKAPNSEDLEGIVVRTPKGDSVRPLEYLHIPWFEFQSMIERYCTSRSYRALTR
jgi:hypothetical protein